MALFAILLSTFMTLANRRLYNTVISLTQDVKLEGGMFAPVG